MNRYCCNNDCNQGRTCPARQACELPIDDDIADPAGAVVTAAIVAVAVLAILCALLPVI